MGLDHWLDARCVCCGNEERICDWRKENWIHNWFVNLSGRDEINCEEFIVKREDLEAFLDDVRYVLDDPEKAEAVLPAKAGFFFGNCLVGDEWYMRSLAKAENEISRALREYKNKDVEFIYNAWW